MKIPMMTFPVQMPFVAEESIAPLTIYLIDGTQRFL